MRASGVEGYVSREKLNKLAAEYLEDYEKRVLGSCGVVRPSNVLSFSSRDDVIRVDSKLLEYYCPVIPESAAKYTDDTHSFVVPDRLVLDIKLLFSLHPHVSRKSIVNVWHSLKNKTQRHRFGIINNLCVSGEIDDVVAGSDRSFVRTPRLVKSAPRADGLKKLKRKFSSVPASYIAQLWNEMSEPAAERYSMLERRLRYVFSNKPRFIKICKAIERCSVIFTVQL